MKLTLMIVVLGLLFLALWIYLITLVIRALTTYIKSKDVRLERGKVRKSLGETIQAIRLERHMTQEFVAESLGVSRQAVSKWEVGTTEPSTSNLIALAKLLNVSVEELIGGD